MLAQFLSQQDVTSLSVLMLMFAGQGGGRRGAFKRMFAQTGTSVDHTCLSVCLREALSGAQEDGRGLKHGLFLIDGNSKRGWGQGSRFTDALSCCFSFAPY